MAGALYSESKSQKEGTKRKLLCPNRVQLDKELDFGLFPNKDLLVWLNGLSLDLCNMNSTPYSTRRLQKQMPKIHKIIMLSDLNYTKRKRNLNQFSNYAKFAAPFELSIEKTNNQNANKKRRGQSSSMSSPHSKGKGDSSQGKQRNTAFSTPNDAANYILLKQDSSLLDSLKSINESNQVKQEPLVIGSGYTQSIKTHQEKPNKKNLEVLESLVILKDPRKTSHTPRSKKEDKELKLELKFLLSSGNSLTRPVIPIGPGFQVEVPRWESPTNKRDQCNGNDLRYLGTQIWPMQDSCAETNAKDIGKGRPDSCFCAFPGLVDCVKQHVSEARVVLQSELGPVFSSMKFDEMGENASKSWTLKEKKKFHSLVKLYPLSNKAGFWKHASEHFAYKPTKSMVSYYYNVYIPRRISQEIRTSFAEVDSD